MNHDEPIVVAIESAIAGGSLSLLKGTTEIAHWVGSSDVSRSEDLLANLDALLASNGISRNEINLIAVSAGPGSFTGIRIGIATALGLKKGLGIPMASESALKAIALTSQLSSKIVGIPMGRNSVCIQHAMAEPITIPTADLTGFIEQQPGTTSILLHDLLCPSLNFPNIINIGSNIARFIGLTCISNPGNVAEPIFVSKNF